MAASTSMMHKSAPRFWRIVDACADELEARLDISKVRRVGIDEKRRSGCNGYDTVEKNTARILQRPTSRLSGGVLEGTNSLIAEIRRRAR